MRIEDSRIDEFEALRGLMALWVVAGHVAHMFHVGPEAAAWLRLATRNAHAVNVFIALSGFVIYALIDRKREPYGLYITRRALRLFPAYLLFLLLSIATLPIALQVLAPDLEHNHWAAARTAYLGAGQSQFWPHLLGHLTLLHGLVPEGWLPHAAHAFIGQAWSISVEWQFYLVAPWLVLAFERHPRLTALGMAAAALASHRWLGDVANQGFVGFHLHYFLLGMLAYWVWRRRLWMPARQVRAIILGCVLGAVATLRLELSLGLWLAACGATLFLHGAGGGRLRAMGCMMVGNPVAQFLGRVSYSVYLSHMVVLYLVVWAMRALWPDRPLGLASLMAVTMAATLLVSHFAYVWVERPCIQLGKAPLRARRVPVLTEPAANPV